jgi:subtilisin family serine protease
MRNLRFLTFVAILPLVIAAPAMRVSATKSANRPSNYAPGEVIVKLKAGAPQLRTAGQDERLMTIARLAGEKDAGSPAEQLVSTTSNQRVSQIITDRGLDRVFVLKLDPGADVREMVSALRARDDVEYAEPNYLIKLGSIPNDPDFAQQWALFNNGIFVGDYATTQNADIKASEAWDITVGSPNVIIALTDTGVDLTHPDLARNIYTNPGEIPGNGIDDDHNGFIDDVHGFNVADQNGDTTDAVGHGTQMAGIIAAEMNNNIGISGVCQSKVMPVRFYKRYGPDPSQFSATVADAARALLYSIAAGASIINASWTTLLDPDVVPAASALALADAVNATNDAGVLLVCIAGNEGYDLDYSKIYPASYFLPNQIVVAASDFNDEIWRPLNNPYVILTGFGPHSVPIAAPGVSVLTTQARGNCFLCTQETDPSKWYTSASGTSVSAACVSGVAALAKSKYPADSGIMLKRRILEGVEVKDSLRSYDGNLTVITGGRLSAIGALTTQLNITPPTLQEINYKAKKQKLSVYGFGIQDGVTVLVGTAAFPGRPQSNDGTAFVAKGVPVTAFPPGTPVQIKLRNPDGGESLAITLTR